MRTKRAAGRAGRVALRAAVIVLIAAVGFAGVLGCGAKKAPPKGAPGDEQAGPPKPSKGVTLKLYFGDPNAMYLEAEERTVAEPGDNLPLTAVKELVKGPRVEGHSRTIPPEARVLDVKVVDGVAYVNFSKEVQTKHWGGSTGETFTIFSLVNTLTELPGVDKVQILVEGEKVETLAGHIDLAGPFPRNEDMIKK